MKKFMAVLTVLAICATIGGTALANHAKPVAEHGIAPGTENIAVVY